MGQAIDSTQIRYFIRRDVSDAVAISEACFSDPWYRADFADCLNDRSVGAFVAEREEAVIGFMIYEMTKSSYHVMNLAVHPAFQHEGVAKQLLGKLYAKLKEKRSEIIVDCRESNLDCQLFLKRCDFHCNREILPGHYDDGEAAYRFRYNLFGKGD